MRAAVRTAVLLVAALFAGACGDDDRPRLATDGWRACRNPELRYRVRHPPDWRPNGPGALAPCTLFDAEPVELLPGTDVPRHVAVSIELEPGPFATLSAADEAERLEARREAVVDGRPAARLEVTAAEGGREPPGTRSTRWVVRMAHGSLVLQATDLGPLPYDRKQAVLDRMVRTLDLTG